MSGSSAIRWIRDPEEKDYAAAQSFLSLLVAPDALSDLIARLRTAPVGAWKAKDVLRAARLPPLKPKQSAEVAAKLKRIKAGDPISPILLVGGLRAQVVIADGYHRASAAYRIDEDSPVPARLLWLTDGGL
ncbi:MAG: hypothetical protein NVSMB25_21040 [Thermoleophilaceae bacterium]